ncbi:ribonuclease E [Acetobacter estunensis NRIC 0472]|uniref:Ribonuclease E n=1 Tax=Acetobacter estunensis TaxID=104097 RepID=A0A967ED54_9PROT|nr:ribonuclease E/G [Acetobacter estunensis]NHO55358.1 Rne/Rng family ribonuclease [Acetobacter estunensis]GBQ27298.1 ribonuclease E [Acetobacter estunensis NRIC 0472]
MTKRMLIDATHAEETRVVVMDGNRLDDYDVEASNRKQLKGNIYLAKVIRVEPSLQAAFVDYGGNRHGFLAFSEIHPDYYQIPVADREKLLALQEEDAESAESEEDAAAEGEGDATDETVADDNGATECKDSTPESVGGETDTGEEALVQKRMARFLRSYKIQEVIRRRQILLVQVVKEERGNKGAALTTYVSLAGRYCVLMPNALRGGGVSRKITSVNDRKRLRDIISELQLPRGMAMIVRTAGAQRPRPEVMRDCEYLLHLWDEIREHTLKSVAPALIYEEASLVKRAIRDVYSRDIEEIIVDGEPAWRGARDFMRMLMPQNAGKVRLWRKESQPLFSHYHVEGLLDAMLSPTVQLKSGGYLVINQTEALVSIDVNSGRATRERNIEETAVRTNLEAADEVARQLRLRDLAGLIVIDFIDMESRRHNTQVERRLKDALRNDRARIQVGGISHFGLLEMSRQRLRPSVAESAFAMCPHCQGTGIVRGIESSALHVLRAIEEEGGNRRAAEINVHVAAEIALYILNNKRDWLDSIERRHHMTVIFTADATLPPPEIRIERRRAQTVRRDAPEPATVTSDLRVEPETSNNDVTPAVEDEATNRRVIAISDTPPETARETGNGDEAPVETQDEGENGVRRRRRGRRRRGNGNGQREENGIAAETNGNADGAAVNGRPSAPVSEEAAEENLVPGRTRTRHSRKVPQTDRQVAPAPAQAAAPAPAPRAAPVPAAREWRGPTPADPFGGSFDIFDIMEQADLQADRSAVAAPAGTDLVAEPDEAIATVAENSVTAPEAEATEEKPSRGRGRGRRRRPAAEEAVAPSEEAPAVKADVATPEEAPPAPVEEEAAKPRRRTRTRRKAAEPEAEVSLAEEASAPAEKSVEAKAEAASKTDKSNERKPVIMVEPTVIEDDAPPAAPRAGWWRR